MMMLLFSRKQIRPENSLYCLVLIQLVSNVAVGPVCSEGCSKLILHASVLNINHQGAPNI